MTELSPAAQAVLDAVVDETRPISEQRELAADIAAALRAAADHIGNVYNEKPADIDDVDVLAMTELRRIATELEGAQ